MWWLRWLEYTSYKAIYKKPIRAVIRSVTQRNGNALHEIWDYVRIRNLAWWEMGIKVAQNIDLTKFWIHSYFSPLILLCYIGRRYHKVRVVSAPAHYEDDSWLSFMNETLLRKKECNIWDSSHMIRFSMRSPLRPPFPPSLVSLRLETAL